MNQRENSPIVLGMVHLQEKQKLAREEKGRMIKKQTQSLLEIKKKYCKRQEDYEAD